MPACRLMMEVAKSGNDGRGGESDDRSVDDDNDNDGGGKKQ